MIVKDVPQVGKLGLTVTWPGRNGLIRRTLVTSANPRTAAQLAVRDSLQQQARGVQSRGVPVDVSACMACVWREYGGRPPGKPGAETHEIEGNRTLPEEERAIPQSWWQ